MSETCAPANLLAAEPRLYVLSIGGPTSPWIVSLNGVVAVPIPTLLVELTSETTPPDSCHGLVAPVAVIVSVLVPVFAASDTPDPAAIVRVSVEEPALIVSEPIAIFLKESDAELLWAVLVIVVPDIEIPDPAVREIDPVCPPIDRTPVFVMIGFCPGDTAIPAPALTLYITFDAVSVPVPASIFALLVTMPPEAVARP